MKRLLTFLVTAAMALAVSPAFAAVVGTPHDYAGVVDGSETRHLCEVCHVPHAGGGGERLWRKAVTASTSTDWDSSSVGVLCAMCHGNTTGPGWAPISNNDPVAPHAVSTAYQDASHGRANADLTNAVASGGVGDTATNASGRPYMTGTSMECTSCHNVHDEGVNAGDKGIRPFLRADNITNPTISKVCGDCHSERYATDFGDANTGGMHPVDMAYADSSADNSKSTYLKASANVPILMRTKVAANAWSLGGKFQLNAAGDPDLDNDIASTNYVGCQTCHAIHNPEAGTDQGNHLLAVNNVAATSALCEGCHGDATGNAARANSGARMMVGTGGQDHPIDCAISTADGGPSIDKWYTDSSTDRYERHELVSDQWPRGTTNQIVCTSCHSAHNAGSPNILRLTRSGGDAGGFCVSCHSDASPLAHHSHAGNDGVTNFSVLDCDSCHGLGASLAHNGFNFNTNFADGTNNQNSELCVWCHITEDGSVVAAFITGVDPATIAGGWQSGGYDPVIVNVPNGNLGNNGANPALKKSHYVGSFSTSGTDINVKTGNWVSSGAAYSKYGGADKHGGTSDSVGATANLICESCHSVLHNQGANIASPTQSSGYEVNLLLQEYKDDSLDDTNGSVGSGLCVGCHNQGTNTLGTGTSDGPVANNIVSNTAIVPAGIHPMTGWTITRAVDDAGRTTKTLITRSVGADKTYADAVGAPLNNTSYPNGADNEMDCDSCHRPHVAPVNSVYSQTQTQSGTAVPVILEKQDAAEEYSDLCQSCHNM